MRKVATVNQTKAARKCIACGTDLTGKRCHRDRKGQYFCKPCHEQSLRKCSVCGAEIRRRDCHRNRHGEYICRRCRRPKIYRRWLQLGYSQVSRAAVYLIAFAVALAVFWKILDLVAE